MKTPAPHLIFAALASALTLTWAAYAQDHSAPAATPPDQPTAAVTSPAAPTPPSAPATAPASTDQPAPAAQPSTAAQPAVPAASVPPDKAAPATPSAVAPATPELRRIDQPAGTPPEGPAKDVAPANAGQEQKAVPAPKSPERHSKREAFNRNTGDQRVSFWRNSQLSAGEHSQAVVSIFGSSTSAGSVADAVVSVFGSSTASGHVGNAVVSVLGSSTSSADVGDAVVSVCGDTRVTGGSVGDSAVSVFGTTYVNARVNGEVVAVLGDVELGPKAEVDGDLVCVGGTVRRDPGAVVRGHVNNVAVGMYAGGFEWLHAWIRNCLLYGRPLAFAPHLMWAWWIALGLLGFYAVLSLLFPGAVVKCAETLEQRPGFSILTAFLVVLLTPAAAILLLITIIGTPALILSLFVAVIFGKVVMLAWIGRRITRHFGESPMAHPAIAVLLGGIIVLLLYTIPVVGFAVSKILAWLGLGVVVFTLIQAIKRKKPAPVTPAVPPGGAVAAGGAAAAPTLAIAGGSAAAAAPGDSAADVPPVMPAAPAAASVPPTIVSAMSLPRAGFWIRIAAALLDVFVVAVAVHLLPLPHVLRPNFLIALAAYCVVFWALRGTTLGGIICGLKVVRLDDRPVDWMTAFVRALGAFLSLIVAGLGFIWVAFDDQKQSWHDKIAGTTIVQVPKGVSLL